MVGAQYGYLPEIFSSIQKRRLTPLPSIVLQVSSFDYELNTNRLFIRDFYRFYFVFQAILIH
jgi:hypothetical protein